MYNTQAVAFAEFCTVAVKHQPRYCNMQTVLIAIDYAPNAEHIAEKGYALAKALQAKVILLHVVSEPVYYASNVYSPIMGFGGYVNTNFLETDVIESLVAQSTNFLETTKLHLNDTSITTMVTHGNVYESILDIAQSTGADVIVMGSISRRWLENVLLGNVAHQVLKATECPVYIIPTPLASAKPTAT